MSLFAASDFEVSQIAPPDISIRPRSTFEENYERSLEHQRALGNAASAGRNVAEAYRVISRAVEPLDPELAEAFRNPYVFARRNSGSFAGAFERVAALKEKHADQLPDDLPTSRAQLDQDLTDRLQKLDAEVSELATVRGYGGFAGSLLGSVVGSLEDPLTAAGLLVGFGGRTIAGVAIKEFLSGAAQELVAQPFIAANRDRHGLDYSAGDALAAVAGAGALGGALGGAGAAVGRLFSRAGSDGAGSDGAGSDGAGSDGAASVGAASDGAASATPDPVRDAVIARGQEEAADNARVNPFVDWEDVSGGGAPARADQGAESYHMLQAQETLGALMRGDPLPSTRNPEETFAPLIEQARARVGETRARADEATARARQAETEAQALRADVEALGREARELSGLGASGLDRARLIGRYVDQASGARMAAIEQDLTAPGLTRARRSDLEAERDRLYATLKADLPLARARAQAEARGLEIAARRELARARGAERQAFAARQDRERALGAEARARAEIVDVEARAQTAADRVVQALDAGDPDAAAQVFAGPPPLPPSGQTVADQMAVIRRREAARDVQVARAPGSKPEALASLQARRESQDAAAAGRAPQGGAAEQVRDIGALENASDPHGPAMASQVDAMEASLRRALEDDPGGEIPLDVRQLENGTLEVVTGRIDHLLDDLEADARLTEIARGCALGRAA